MTQLELFTTVKEYEFERLPNRKEAQIINDVFNAPHIKFFLDDIIELYHYKKFNRLSCEYSPDAIFQVIGASKRKNNLFYCMDVDKKLYLFGSHNMFVTDKTF